MVVDNSVAFLNPLFTLSRYFGIQSPSLQSSKRISRSWKVYSLVLTTTIWIVYFLTLYTKVTTFYHTLNYFALCLDVTCDFFMSIANTFAVCYCTFIKPELTDYFVSMLSSVDDVRCIKANNSFKKFVFYIEFGAIYAILGIYELYNAYAFGTKLKKPVYGVIIKVITHFIIITSVYQMYNFVLIIGEKFRQLNKRVLSGITSLQQFRAENVDAYITTYSKVCDMTDAFNTIFGNQLFYIVGFVVINTIEGVQVGLLCFTRSTLTFISKDCSVIGVAIALETVILAVSIVISCL